MSPWRVIVAHEAESTLRRLDRRQQTRLRAAIDRLGEGPSPGPGRDIRPLHGVPDLWRLRVGGWRILFTVQNGPRVISVAAVRPRGQAYRGLR
ncbi:MAG TPA: type II toxin-antitoxin system RelE/ParE family toxin [Chloroflexota bacterium]|nr:type II toxin-antitoxin system RelE/ParE family toxin [Chloroflexota bacterium]